ncbi:MAG: integration host factor subunit beta [Spirochaeta sp. LUC14_002_19_P3]|nr:MAG: integration host factor subunit beta [Spirochaeta sp. LUC14_002_19_P3]
MSSRKSQSKMTKAEIIENIYNKSGVQQKDIYVVIDEFFQEIKGALREDRVVELRGFGTFEIRTRKGRERARNPKTGEIVPVKTHGVAIFRPGQEIRKMSWDIRTQ